MGDFEALMEKYILKAKSQVYDIQKLKNSFMNINEFNETKRNTVTVVNLKDTQKLDRIES